MSVVTVAVLLSDKCPTGQHVGSVVADRMGLYHDGQVVVPWPPQYLCGCEDPRDSR